MTAAPHPDPERPDPRAPDPAMLARRFYALGDEIRLAVVELLWSGGERCVCELTACLRMAQSRLSFHLKVLKDSGLITHRRQGRWSYYALDRRACREVEDFLGRPAAPSLPCCSQPALAKDITPERQKEQR